MKLTTLFLTAISLVLFSVNALATTTDSYNAELILTGRIKGGLLVSGSHGIKGQIVVKKNSNTIQRIPVLVNELSLGLSAGIQTSGSAVYTTLKIEGLTANTRLSDFFDDYYGGILGGTFAVPAACCIVISKEKISAKNNRGLKLSGNSKSVGWMIDIANLRLGISYDPKFTDRFDFEDKTLEQLEELAYTNDNNDKSLIDLGCKENNKSESHFLKLNPFQEIIYSNVSLNLKDLFKDSVVSGLKPTISNNILTLYPESINNKVYGYRIDVDLASEKKIAKDFFGREYTYAVQISSAKKTMNLSCLSKTSLNADRAAFSKYHSSFWQK